MTRYSLIRVTFISFDIKKSSAILYS